MSSHNIIKVCKITEEIKSELQGAVIFAGSHISVYQNSGVPSGEIVISSLFTYLFGDEYSKDSKLYEEYKKIPFEALMEIAPAQEKVLSAIINLYSCSTPNPVHKALVKLLHHRKIASIITPNYDLCIDQAQKEFDNISLVVDEKDIPQSLKAAALMPYFKIHGTADPERAESIVYTLKQEGELPCWKKKFLQKLVKDKVILFLGYSGRDFDICPLIAKAMPYKKIYWLSNSGVLSAYSQYLIKSNQSNVIFLGDLICLLDKVYETKIASCDSGNVQFSPSNIFGMTGHEILVWKINVLDRLGMTSVGLKVCEQYRTELGEDFYLKMKASFLAHEGRYADAKKYCLQRAQLSKITEANQIDALMHAAGISIPLGEYWNSYRLQQKVRKRLAVPGNEDFQNLHLRFIRESFTFKMRIFQIFRKIPPLILITMLVKRSARKNYASAFKELGSSGSWDDRQLLQHNAERLGIPTENDSIALSSNVGFVNLGMPNMDIIRYRDFLRFGTSQEQIEKIKKIDEYIRRAEFLGIKTEVWKLSRLKLLRNKNNLSIDQQDEYFAKWRKNLKNTQYVPFLKVLHQLEYWTVRFHFWLAQP